MVMRMITRNSRPGICFKSMMNDFVKKKVIQLPYSEFLHSFIGLSATLPFLPLLLYSLYTSIGITSAYLSFYAHYLRS